MPSSGTKLGSENPCGIGSISPGSGANAKGTNDPSVDVNSIFTPASADSSINGIVSDVISDPFVNNDTLAGFNAR